MAGAFVREVQDLASFAVHLGREGGGTLPLKVASSSSCTSGTPKSKGSRGNGPLNRSATQALSAEAARALASVGRCRPGGCGDARLLAGDRRPPGEVWEVAVATANLIFASVCALAAALSRIYRAAVALLCLAVVPLLVWGVLSMAMGPAFLIAAGFLIAALVKVVSTARAQELTAFHRP